jgi:hypothetical protein
MICNSGYAVVYLDMAKNSAFYITGIAPAHQNALSLPKVTVADGLVLFNKEQ